MTKQWYQEHGYKMSNYIEDAEITRAEALVRDAYITPIVGSVTIPEEVLNKTLAELAFLYLLQQSVFLTRSGAKIKTGYNSQQADTWDLLQQSAMTCHLALVGLRKQPGVNATAEVTDICKIYFKTNFFNL